MIEQKTQTLSPFAPTSGVPKVKAGKPEAAIAKKTGHWLMMACCVPRVAVAGLLLWGMGPSAAWGARATRIIHQNRKITPMCKLLKLVLVSFILGGSLPINAGHASQADHSKDITVFKTPWCGCCEVWVEALREAGYMVKSTDMEDLSLIKKQGSVPKRLEACHTAVIGSDRKYVLEGHVPLEAIEKLMSETPDIRGIATPGMPTGSLGMGYDEDAQYSVYAYSGKTNEAPTVFFEAGKK